MAQSDYLKQKKLSNILKSQEKLPYVLPSKDYTSFIEFSQLKSSSSNTSVSNYNSLPVVNITHIFDNPIFDISGCTSFSCVNTHQRPNRKPIYGEQTTCFPVIKPPGLSVPTYYNGSTKKKPEKDYCACIRKQ